MSEDHVQESWEKFLHPDSLRSNLLRNALFITIFEMLQDYIVEQPKYFFCHGFDEDGLLIDDKYQEKVLDKDDHPVEASLLWFEEHGAISEKDIEIYHEIREHRGEVVHEFLDFLSNAEKELDLDLFEKLIELFTKISKWWVREVEIPTDPQFDNQEISNEEIIPGPVLQIQTLLDIALGNEPEEGFYFDKFNENFSDD